MLFKDCIFWQYKFLFFKREPPFITDDSFENVDVSKLKFERVIFEILKIMYKSERIIGIVHGNWLKNMGALMI